MVDRSCARPKISVVVFHRLDCHYGSFACHLCPLGPVQHIQYAWGHQKKMKEKFTIGLFGTLAILGALLIFLWLLTFQDPDSLYSLTTASFFLIGGLTLSFTMIGVRLEPFRMTNFLQSVMVTALNVAVILYVNRLVPLKFEFSIMDPQLFGTLIGIAEECFFTLFLCGLLLKLSHSSFIAIVASSAIWSTYHVARYGGNPNVLFIIFLCGCVLRATFIYTRNIDGSLFGHGCVNYIAVG